ncbi:MAG: tetratricopeptide repeat protein [Planctomycetota bacterium]
MLEQIRNHRHLLVCILLAAATFAVYLPVWNHEFVYYDDDVYITKNPNVQSGLSWQGVKWAFTSGYASNWHPLTWLSHQLDWQLFGDNAGAHHIVNILFHIANTILLFVVLNRMTKGFWQSAFVAGLFALHPLHVESAAWVAERKDVLSTLLWLLTMLFYVRYAERPTAGRYVVVPVLFSLGLMAKPMLVTLPFVLLLLDYWPLGRLGSGKYTIKRLLLEKLPLLFLSAASSVVTYLVQQKSGAMTPLPFGERVSNAICSYLAYIGKMLWPARLAVLYPHPLDTLPAARAVTYGVILIIMTLFFTYYSRRHKYLLVGWLWYIGTLVPVIGIVQVGAQAMADRYTYVPLTGLFIIIAFGGAELLKNIPLRKTILTILASGALLGCVVVTSLQLKYWRNSYLLFDRALTVIEDNAVMQNNYANILSELGRPEEAVKHLSEALKYIPNSPVIHNNYGNALMRDMGKVDEAIEHYKFALELNPDFAVAHYNLGVAMATKGNYDEAIRHYKQYLGPDANIADIHEGLATMLAREGKVADAVGQFQKALAAKPDSAEVLGNLGYAIAQSGDPEQAIKYYESALQIDPEHIITHGRLALALAAVGRIDDAIEQCRIVLKARPDDAEMFTNLGILLQAKGNVIGAADAYKKALKIDPDDPKARKNLNAITQH